MRKTGIFINAKESMSAYNYLTKYMSQPIPHDYNFVLTLLELGININQPIKNSNSNVLFFCARQMAEPDIVELLLRFGANVNQRTWAGTNLVTHNLKCNKIGKQKLGQIFRMFVQYGLDFGKVSD